MLEIAASGATRYRLYQERPDGTARSVLERGATYGHIRTLGPLQLAIPIGADTFYVWRSGWPATFVNFRDGPAAAIAHRFVSTFTRVGSLFQAPSERVYHVPAPCRHRMTVQRR
jgi:hypothetical protein